MSDISFVFSAEALHLAHLMAAHGYLFPIDDHILTVKNDNTYYRFQVWYDRCCMAPLTRWVSMAHFVFHVHYANWVCTQSPTLTIYLA